MTFFREDDVLDSMEIGFVSAVGLRPQLRRADLASRRSISTLRCKRLETARNHRCVTVSLAEESAVEGLIPASFNRACEQARDAMTASLSSGQRRLFVELDTTNGDATYTTLKTTLPSARALLDIFDNSSVQIVLPDAGAAALAQRDWGPGLPSQHRVVGIEQFERRADDAAVFVVVPRASDVDGLVKLVDACAGADDVIIVINPDLVDMGVTGLSLNARQLRTAVIDTFDTVFYLRVFDWGVLYRRFPDGWSVWVDDSNEANGFRRIASMDMKPSTDEIIDLVDEDESKGNGASGNNPLSKVLSGFRRFLRVYTKG